MSQSTTPIDSINERYSQLAGKACCLSCGGAINHLHAQAGDIVVDLGSGKGSDAIRIAETVGSTGFVYGIDVADGMLKIAKNTAHKLGVNNVKFVKSELEHIDLANETVDIVTSNCTINHAADKQQVFNEIYRILKKGGRFVISDIYSQDEVPERFKNDPEAIAECWGGAITKSAYLRTIEEAGFAHIEVIEESTPYHKGEINVSSWTLKGVKL